MDRSYGGHLIVNLVSKLLLDQEKPILIVLTSLQTETHILLNYPSCALFETILRVPTAGHLLIKVV